MTFDRAPMPEQELDPKGLVNFDSPFFDLASVYGRGPDLDPQFYKADGKYMRIVRTAEGVEDLPRLDDGTALIGDPRNDENLILSQLHLLFLKFHNRCLDTGLAKTLAQAQRLTRWHFQWVIVNDFLKAVVGAELVSQVLQGSPPKPKIDFYKPVDANRPMMPIEYAVAAFRFGHSMVRGRYTLNAAGGVPLFDPSSPDLRGGRPLPAAFEIEWWRFFPGVRGAYQPAQRSPVDRHEAGHPLAEFAANCGEGPDGVAGATQPDPGQTAGPSGRAGRRKANEDEAAICQRAGLTRSRQSRLGWQGTAVVLHPARGGDPPGRSPTRPAGAKLVAEVIVGILSCDKSSYIYDKTPFQPAPPIAPSGQFTMGEFAAFAQGA